MAQDGCSSFFSNELSNNEEKDRKISRLEDELANMKAMVEELNACCSTLRSEKSAIEKDLVVYRAKTGQLEADNKLLERNSLYRAKKASYQAIFYGVSAMKAEISQLNLSSVKFALEMQQPGEKTRLAEYLLISASKNGAAHIVRFLLNKFWKIGRIRELIINKALLAACTIGCAEVVGLLLDRGADLHTRATNGTGATPLMLAVASGSRETVHQLLQRDCSTINSISTCHEKDNSGNGVVHALAADNSVNEAKMSDFTNLIMQTQQPIDCDELLQKFNSRGENLMHLAAKMNNIGIVKWLLEKGENSEITKTNWRNKMTPLMYAASGGSVDVVRELVKQECFLESLGDRDKNGMTVLMYAAEQGSVDVVRELLKHPRCLESLGDGENKNGMTVLMLAAERGSIDVFRELLKQPKCLESHGVRCQGNNVLMSAAIGGSVEIVRQLLKQPYCLESFGDGRENNSGMVALMMNAARGGSVEVVRELLKQQRCLNSVGEKDKNGMTVLMYAAEQGSVDVVRELLKQPCCLESLGYKDNVGKTLVMYAAEQGSLDVVNELLNQQRCLNSLGDTDNNGMTVLMYAVRGKSVNTVRELLKQPACLESLGGKDKNGKTLLMYAAQHSSVYVVRELLKQPRCLESLGDRDNSGMTVLMFAVIGGSADVVRELLKQPRCLESLDDKIHKEVERIPPGKTAADIAAFFGLEEIIGLLNLQARK